MTSDDSVLDPEPLLKHRDLTLYRICRDKYADLSGIGAALMPGRWNLPGQEAIYTTLNSSTAQLEVLGHTPKDHIPSNLVRMEIELSGNWKHMSVIHAHRSLLFDPDSGNRIRIFHSLREAREFGLPKTWSPQVLGIAVPSVHDEQWNVILFPSANGFSQHVSIQRINAFRFDDRLFAVTPSSAT